VWARRKGRHATFIHVLEPYREATGPKVSALERVAVTDADGKALPAGQAAAVRITLTDGTQDLIVRNDGGSKVRVAGRTVDVPLAIFRNAGGDIDTYLLDEDD
jgi:hypothetical protein